MIVTIGRIVHYILSEQDAENINRRRVAKPYDPGWPPGAQAHVGNFVKAGEIVPMIVCVVWTNEPNSGVNGQAFLDGNDSLWVTSAQQGTTPGTWQWPKRNDE